MFDLKNHDINVSRNVLFYKDIFPSCFDIDDSVVNNNDVYLPSNQSYNSIFDKHDNEYGNIIIDVKQYDKVVQVNNSKDVTNKKSNRTRSVSAHLKDYHTNLVCIKASKYPIQSYISLSRLLTCFQQVTLSIDS